MDKRIFHIKNKLSQTLGNPWSVEKMAVEAEMSVSNFQRLFKDEVGIAPMAYLNDLRLEKAREMLADPVCFSQIKQIRVQVGMNNDSHFTRDFKEKNGMTPTEYCHHQAEIHQSASSDGH